MTFNMHHPSMRGGRRRKGASAAGPAVAAYALLRHNGRAKDIDKDVELDLVEEEEDEASSRRRRRTRAIDLNGAGEGEATGRAMVAALRGMRPHRPASTA